MAIGKFSLYFSSRPLEKYSAFFAKSCLTIVSIGISSTGISLISSLCAKMLLDKNANKLNIKNLYFIFLIFLGRTRSVPTFNSDGRGPSLLLTLPCMSKTSGTAFCFAECLNFNHFHLFVLCNHQLCDSVAAFYHEIRI